MIFEKDEYTNKEKRLLEGKKLSNVIALRAIQDGKPDLQIVSVTCKGGLKEQIVVVRADSPVPYLASDDEVGEIFDHIGWQWKHYRMLTKEGARVFIQSDKTTL